MSRAGYFRQEIDPQGRQIEHADDWDPARYATRLQATVALDLEDRQVWVGGWLFPWRIVQVRASLRIIRQATSMRNRSRS